MSNRYNFLYFEAEFKKYLIAGKAGASTVKNYLSDLHYFFSWVKISIGSDGLDCSNMPNVFTVPLVRSFYHSLSSSANSDNTSVRRFATLRKFFSFCIEQRWMSTNPANEHLLKSKRDEREELLFSYAEMLKSKQLGSDALARHISVARDLVINFSLL